jgi:hypothetical protein
MAAEEMPRSIEQVGGLGRAPALRRIPAPAALAGSCDVFAIGLHCEVRFPPQTDMGAPRKNHFPTRARSASSCRMTHAPPDARTPRTSAEYRWTPSKAHAFIEALALHGKVAAAARAVGMTRQSAYRLRDRVPQVADVWVRAQAVGRARRRGKVTVSPTQGDTSRGAR